MILVVCSDPARDVVALVVEDVFDVAVELDLLGVFGPDDFPRRAEAHPVVGQLDLVAVAELLAEEAELVVDAVADGRVVERGQRIEEAGRQTAQPPLPRPMSRRGGREEVAQEGQGLRLARRRREPHGLRRRKAGELVPGQVEVRPGHPALAQRADKVADEGLGVPRLHPGRKRLDAEEIPAELETSSPWARRNAEVVGQDGRGHGVELDRNRQEQALHRTRPAWNCPLRRSYQIRSWAARRSRRTRPWEVSKRA
jgi:hypothetical protein